jgi:glycosyltransferase involved in cell wall biosynthesis
MQVSVIIPVYNAAAYIEQAVLSALSQPETGEIILVEDGSHDDSLLMCQRLAQTHNRVQLLRHDNGQNKGAGASRNLGITHSRYELIAFLDADDYYLPERFTGPVQFLEKFPEADGVYEATQDFYDSDEILQKHEKAGTRKMRLNTMREKVQPKNLFRSMHLEPLGHFWICSMTLRARVFTQTGLFDEHLRVAQDKVMIRKMAALCRLHAGRLDTPVAMRRVHARNRVTGVERSPDEWMSVRRLDWETMRAWGEERLTFEQKQILMIYFTGALNRGVRMKYPFTRFVPWYWLSVATLLNLNRRYPDLYRQPYYQQHLLRTSLYAIYPPKLLQGMWTSLKRYIARRTTTPVAAAIHD